MRVPRRPSVLLVVLAAACAPERAVAPSAAVPGASVARTRAPSTAVAPGCPAVCDRALARARARLERAAAGLTYLSESDYPFEFVSAAAPRGPGPRDVFDEVAFRAAFGVAPSEPVEVVALDAFLKRHTEPADPADAIARALAPRYRALQRTVHAVTGTTRVYRVGRSAVRCYLVGADAWGNVVGLATTAVET